MNSDEIIRILDELQTRLDGPARYIFELTVKQVIIEAWVPLAVGVVAAFSLIGSAFVAILHDRHCTVKQCEHWPIYFGLLGGGLSVIAAAVSLGWFVITGIPKMMNPEYAALERILQLVIPQ